MNPDFSRVVVKVGTSLLTRGRGLDGRRMARLVGDLAYACKQGKQILLVSSGAIGAGMGELGWTVRPADLPAKQAAAAVGQPRLMETYRRLFRRHGLSVAQVLLTREDFEDPARRRNAQATLHALLGAGVVPIINENDTVAVEEIRLGDNDTLAARVAVKVRADLLILLTDVQGLMTRPPRHGRGRLIDVVEKIDARIEALAHGTPGSEGGTGGMLTKIKAGCLATENGVRMIIASGRRREVLRRLFDGFPEGTCFLPQN